MGNLLGSRRITSCLGACASCLLLLAASCGSGDDTDNPFSTEDGAGAIAPTNTTPPGLLPCSEDRHLVAFDVAGLLTTELDGPTILMDWNAGTRPEPRPGTPEVVTAYRDRGYEVIYMVGMKAEGVLGGVPTPEAIDSWLADSAFPTGEGTHSWFWDVAEGTTVWTSISNELLRFAGDGVTIDAAYTENPDRAYGFATAGVPAERLFTLESIPVQGQVTSEGTPAGPANNPVPHDDFVAHLESVNALAPVCQVG